MSIYPRTNYQMTEQQEKDLLACMTATPVMKIGSSWSGGDQQERANEAWKRLGQELGFDHMTVQPRAGCGQRHFTAIPSETEEQRIEREKKQAEEKQRAEIAQIRETMAKLNERLAELEATA